MFCPINVQIKHKRHASLVFETLITKQVRIVYMRYCPRTWQILLQILFDHIASV